MTWDDLLKEEFQKDYMQSLHAFLKEEYSHYTCFPPSNKIFNALALTPYEDVRVVILGQDPYHNIGQAMGLSFSVPAGTQLPPSLQNIFKELYDETGIHNTSGDLTPWARQGILLLNTTLTVRENQARSHFGRGWETFTDAIIRKVNEKERPIIFVLWGNDAKRKEPLITQPNHVILKASHPSPLSAYNGFFGCGHFNKINELLKQCDEEPIDWRT